MGFRADDLVFDVLTDYSKKTGVSISDMINAQLLEIMKKIPDQSANVKLIEHKLALREYKRKRRQKWELRYEIDNVLKKIYMSAFKDRFKGLEPNIVQIISIVEDFEKLYMTYPDELKIELKNNYDYLISLKYPGSLSEFLSKSKIMEDGKRYVKSRKRIEQH